MSAPQKGLGGTGNDDGKRDGACGDVFTTTDRTEKRLVGGAVAWDRPDGLTRDDVLGKPERWRIYAGRNTDGTLDGTYLLRDPRLGTARALATTADALRARPLMYSALPRHVADCLRQFVARYFAERALAKLGGGA
jgi:hypothetical protein